jgi:hypothetical protein
MRSHEPSEFNFIQIHDFVRGFISDHRFEGSQTLYISKQEFKHWLKVIKETFTIYGSEMIKRTYEMEIMGQKVKYYDY